MKTIHYSQLNPDPAVEKKGGQNLTTFLAN
jgi:hypothetical protein